MGSVSAREMEYLEFLEKYGHLDFSLLKFLPMINLEEERRLLQSSKSPRSTKTSPRPYQAEEDLVNISLGRKYAANRFDFTLND
jgi:hypothetical protein